MSANEPNRNAVRDDFEDRLADLTLAEVLGDRRPPDLSQRVLAASREPRRSWRTAAQWALAASILIAAGVGAYAWRAESQREREQLAHASRDLREIGQPLDAHARHETMTARHQQDLAKAVTEFQSLDPLITTSPATSDAPHSVRSMTDFAKELGGNSNTAFIREHAVQPNPENSKMTVTPRILVQEQERSLHLHPDGGQRTKQAGATAQAFDRRIPSPTASEQAARGLQTLNKHRDEYRLAVEGKTSARHLSIADADPARGEGFRKGLEDNIRDAPANHPDAGVGPGQAGDRYSRIVENPFLKPTDNPLSTFSIDVDTASYAKSRRYLLQNNVLPPPDAVRIEEFVNYFPYDYAAPADDKPFAAHVEVAACPWQPTHRLVRIGLKGREIQREARPTSNLVFLLDVSGSMQPDDRLPRVRRSMRMLVEQLGENDRVAIVVYAGASGLVLPSTPGLRKAEILSALENLLAGGSTNGGAGIRLAYDIATEQFIKGGVNRVILCTDGDFNVGTTSTGELQGLAEEKARSGVFLTVLGFGMGNHNDDMLEKLADKGNGNYGYIDTEEEARKLLVEELSGTLVTIAKDVKIQVEFNPRTVGAYRLLGYENRLLRAEDFNDDRKDAGEIGAGHTVTALYELVPPGEKLDTPPVDPLRYQQLARPADATTSGELLTLKLRYKEPDGQQSQAPLIFPVSDRGQQFGQASVDFKFAASVAGFALLLRDSQHRGNLTYDALLEIAASSRGADPHGYRAEFLKIVEAARQAAGK